MARQSRRARLVTSNHVWLLAALALGLGVRVYRLAAQSLWNDEGTSIALARLSLPAIASGAAHDIHPPLYYFFLHFWMDLAGSSELTVRFLSVLAGVLLIATTFRIAREFFKPRVAVIAAFLSALSAFQLYYSQETRMYMLVTLWTALSVLAMVWMFAPARPPPTPTLDPSPVQRSEIPEAKRKGGRGWGGGPRRRTIAWLIYILVTTAALYTHYFAFTLVLFENLAFLAWLVLAVRARRSAIPHSVAFWVAAQILIALAFLPWLRFAGNQLTNWPAISEPLSLADLVSRVLNAFVLGTDTPPGVQVWIVGAYALFLVVGFLAAQDLPKASIWGITLNAFWAIVPLAAMYGVSLQRPAYNPKFLLLATPGFFILAARGISILSGLLALPKTELWLERRHSPRSRALSIGRVLVVVGIVLAGAWLSIQSVYFDPHLQRDDYRGIVSYINAVARSEDAVLIDAPGQIDVFRYYYRGAAEVQTLPIGRPLQKDATQQVLADLANRRQVLFAVFWATEQADPENFVERELATLAFKASDDWHGNVRLAQYRLPHTSEGGEDLDGDARFGDEIQLVSIRLSSSRWLHRGDILPFEFQWHALKRPLANYKVFLHLLNAQGQIVSQRDVEPLNGFRPTTSWNANELVKDRIGLLIPLHTPPGEYTVISGLYQAEDGARLPITSGRGESLGDYLSFGTVHVQE